MGKAEIMTEARGTLGTSAGLCLGPQLYSPSEVLTLGPSGTV